MTVPVHGLPPLLCEGMTVAAVPPALKGSRWHTVRAASVDGGSGQLVALSGVRTIGDAEALAGKTLLARVADLPEGFELHDVDALLGRMVCDEMVGPLGSIVEVLTGPANDVWVVDDGPFGELLLPVIPDVVMAVPADGPILVRVPAGMLPVDGVGEQPDTSAPREE